MTDDLEVLADLFRQFGWEFNPEAQRRYWQDALVYNLVNVLRALVAERDNWKSVALTEREAREKATALYVRERERAEAERDALRDVVLGHREGPGAGTTITVTTLEAAEQEVARLKAALERIAQDEYVTYGDLARQVLAAAPEPQEADRDR